MAEEPRLYWLAVLGAAVVPAPDFMTPLSRTLMAQAMVRIGRDPSEPTLWSIDAPMESNNPPDRLIGFKTAEQRWASFQVLLNAPIEMAAREAHRCERDEVTIGGVR